MVFFLHCNPFQRAGRSNNSTVELLAAFVGQWHIGGTIFFVLSSFLIAVRYPDRVEPSRDSRLLRCQWQWASQLLFRMFFILQYIYTHFHPLF